MTFITTEQAVKALTSRIAREEATLAKFKTELNEHPAFAFQWADSAMAAAATLYAYQGALRVLTAPDTKATVQSMAEYYMNEVLRSARNVNSSSSQSANMMANHGVAAMAMLVELFTDRF